jgi:hypothetical protein
MENFVILDNLIPEIVSFENLSSSFDYVVRGLKEKQRKRFEAKKDDVIAFLRKHIEDGSFQVTNFETLHVKDGPKEREVQAPPVIDRIGCHAIMNVFEDHVYPTVIETSAASIKGRGMHYLHHILEEDIHECEGNLYYYQCDIHHFYDSINQELMYDDLKHYVSDPIVLKIFSNFVHLLPNGLSKGLRSSQCFANLHLSPIDHHMKEVEGVRYYYRYCDDIVMMSTDKRELWKWRGILHQELGKLGLQIKKSEAIRPITVGLDFLGFVHYEDYSLIRKRTKQKAARHLAKVKSRKRRQEIIGSFKGMACHADCKNLFFKLTNKRMKKFSELGITYTPEDGKKRFPGKAVRLSAIVNKEIEIHDYEKDVKTSQGEGRYIVSFKDAKTGEWAKFFTASDEMKQILDKASDIEDCFPFTTVIESEVFDGNKVKYRFT